MEGLGNENEVPYPKALLPQMVDLNWGPHFLVSVVLHPVGHNSSTVALKCRFCHTIRECFV